MSKTHTITTLKKVGLIILVGGVAASAGLLYLGHEAIKPQPKAPAAIEQPFVLDPAVKALGAQLGIPEQELVATKARIGELPKTCEKVGRAGCYFNGEIVINTQTGNLTPVAVLGHEYMHHVWAHKVDSATKERVTALTQAFYTKYQANVASRFAAYDGIASAQEADERQAIFCTEIRDSRLQPELLAYCKTYLPNRNALPSYF